MDEGALSKLLAGNVQCALSGEHLRRRSSSLFGRFCADHHERVAREGSASIYFDPFFWATTTECTLTLFVLSAKVALSRFCSTPNVDLDLFVFFSNLPLRLIVDARLSNQHFKVPPKYTMATGDAFSRVELLMERSDESAALALHIASGDVQNAFHHMAISDWLRPSFCLRPLCSWRFRHDTKDRGGRSCLYGTEVVSCASDAANGVLLSA